jgi:hypothetical protein
VSSHLQGSVRDPAVEAAEGPARAPVPDVSAPAPAARVAALVAVGSAVVALVLGVLGVTLLGGGGAGEIIDGVIEATLTGSGDRVQLVAGDPVPEAATLRTEDGPATIRVSGGDLWLEDGSTLVVAGDGLALERGHLLVSSRAAIRVEVASVVAQGRGVWRADLGTTSRVGTYRGRVQADDGRRTQQLARFEQVDLQGASVGAAVPLRYSEQDGWDREHLADALAMDRLARQLLTSLEADHGPAPRPPSFYSSFTGADEAVIGRLDDLAPRRQAERVGPPATVLLGIAVADALVVDGGFLPATAVGRVIELRRGGAGWGLVLVAHDLGPSALRAAAERALERAAEDPPPAAVTSPAPAPGQTNGQPVEGPTRGGDPDVPQGGGAPPGPGPVPGPTPSPSPAPSPSPSPSPEGDPLDPVDDIVREGSETLSDLLEGANGAIADRVGTVDARLTGGGGPLGGS